MAKNDEDRQSEERIRALLLQRVQHYLDQALQRMGQTRGQLRRRQGQRAYRRSTATLTYLKRARDQLRDPVEVLGVILADARALARWTGQLAGAEQAVIVGPTGSAPPAWLNQDNLSDLQLSTTERTAELGTIFDAGLKAHEGVAPTAGPAPSHGGVKQPDVEAVDPQRARFVEKVRQAAPLVHRGEQAFAAAGTALSSEDYSVALDHQMEGILALAEGREFFLDLRGLIELMYADQLRVRGFLTLDEDAAEELIDEFLPPARQLQERNLTRSKRLGEQIQYERQQMDRHAEEPPTGNDAGTSSSDVHGRRFDQAERLLNQATAAMNTVIEHLKFPDFPRQPSDPETDTEKESDSDVEADEQRVPVLPEAVTASGEAVEHLQALRRLFYSIVEHLRETAQRQSEHNDQTERVWALPEEERTEQQVRPLVPRQQELREISHQIAEALQQQGQQALAAPAGAPAGPSPPNADQQQQAQQVADQFRQASALVSDAAKSMQRAVEHLEAGDTDLSATREHQDGALQHLLEALDLLVPPDQQQQNQQQQQQQQQSDGQQEQQDQKPSTRELDPARLLQAVRDREARRRREKSERQRSPYQPVEKDW